MAFQLSNASTMIIDDKAKYEILFFFSTSNYDSVTTKLILNNYLFSKSINNKCILKEIDIDNNSELCKKYNVSGVPTTMVFFNNELLYRHLGELSNKELDLVFKELQ